ncbi:MAG: response regulator transcription factor [Bdellovibrionales bacterium]|nr:response regulator transcription factor [Bdellovibrionales bacterium]
MKALLLVEDDLTLGRNLCERLQNRSFSVDWAKSAETAQVLLHEKEYDLALIDIGLPADDGFTVARSIGSRAKPFPFVFLTAMSSAEFRLEAFELGAADYIPKPFHLKELYLRLERILGSEAPADSVSGPDFVLHRDEMALHDLDGATKRLPAREFQLLWALVSRSPKIVSRKEILGEIWESGESSNQRSIDNAISHLRQSLSPASSARLKSYRGIGYFWEAA